DLCCLAEEVGFGSVFVSDHFQPWKHTGGHAPFSFAWLAALGAKTRRVEIGTSVATPTFRYHPSVVAQAFGTLGAMFPDRVVLGVGTGESLNDVPATGMKWPGFKERQGRLREAIALMRRLWGEERGTGERGGGDVRGPVLRDAGRHDLRQAGKAGADLARRLGTDRRCDGRRTGRRVHLHEREGGGALPRHPAAESRGRVEARRPA